MCAGNSKGSLELLIVGVLASMFVVLVLDDRADNGKENDESHVEVEPGRESVSDIIVPFLGECELVGETTSVEADSAEEHVATGESSADDEDVLVEEEGEDGGGNSASNAHTPEDGSAASEEEDGLAEQDTAEEATPAGDKCGTDSLELHYEEADDEADKDRAAEDGPANPSLSTVREECGVEKEEDSEDGENGGHNEDGCLEQLATEEAEEAADTDEESAPDPRVLVHELPESVKIESGAHIRCGHCRRVVFGLSINVNELSSGDSVLVRGTDKTDVKGRAR